jgi:transposase-like protein
MKYFRNVDIASEFLVDESTVRKWIRDAKQGKLDLILSEENGKLRVANTTRNREIMQGLVKSRRKFRNSKAAEVSTPPIKSSGIWQSTHSKAADGPNAVKTSHYVTLRLIGNQIIIESLSEKGQSYLFARFTLEGNVATGIYQSENSPNTRAKGAVYYGSAQLILDDDGNALRGMGVGFNKDMKASATDWTLEYVSESTLDKV